MDLRNERLTVIELQQDLLELWQAGMKIPYVTPDGVYGDVTRSAVRDFQRQSGLDGTGVVDYPTWERLTSDAGAALLARQPADRITPFVTLQLDGGAVRPGEKSDLVTILQIMLAALSLYDLESLPLTGVFDAATQKALKKFQSLHGLSPCGNLDQTTWNDLSSAYNRAQTRKDEL